MFLTIDFETRSAVDIKAASYRRYATHPSTGILCLGMQWRDRPASVMIPPSGQPTFIPGMSNCPIEIRHAIENRLPIYAHNIAFDRTIYEEICVKKLGWPAIPTELWRDTIAIASYYAMPRGLDQLTKALGCAYTKDTKGGRVLKQVCKPRKPRKAERLRWEQTGRPLSQMPYLWYEDSVRLHTVYEYCRRDVEAQTECLLRLGPLPADRHADWSFDQMINARGVPLDIGSVIDANRLIESTFQEYNQKIAYATKTMADPQGAVQAVTQRDRIIDWCQGQGFEIDSLKKDVLEKTLERNDVPPLVRYVLTLRSEAGKSSLGKIETMLDLVDDDWRVRDTLVYHKASTGRWAGRGIQPHNFPRECLDAEQAERFHFLLNSGLPLDEFGTTIPELLTQCLRSFIKATDGNSLFISDFAAIESRVLAWLARCPLILQAYHNGVCVYRQFAERATGKPYDKIGKNDFERRLGKVAVLGLGYGMGGKARNGEASKFQQTAAGPGYRVELTEFQSEQIVKLFRTMYPEIPALWRDLEKGMMAAIETMRPQRVGFVTIGCNGQWAWIQLPSGRCIWYNSPRIERVMRFEKMQNQITFMGINPRTKKWMREATWGGTLAENVTQAVAGDILIAAMKRTENAGYPNILSVHDEVVAEAPSDASLDKFHEIMKIVPAWAPGLPIDCESHRSQRYGK